MVAFTDGDQNPGEGELKALTKQVITLPRRTYQPARLGALAAFLSPQPRSLADTFDRSAQQVIQETAHTQYDAIFACQLNMAVYARGLAHPVKIFDEVETGLYTDAYQNARGARRLRHQLTWLKYARYLRTIAHDFSALTVVSSTEQARLVNIGIPVGRIHIIANGVDCNAGTISGGPREPFTLIYNGALTYSANYDAMQYFVRDILPQIRAQEPRVQLKITGRAPQFAINELSQDNVVSFTGYVPDVRAEVRSCTLCVVPLRTGGGTRLKILEAMAVGTPVITTTKGAEGLEMQNGEQLIIADSPAAFARATLQLLSDEPLRLRLARAALERVRQQYDWQIIQARMEQVLVNCIQKP